MAVPSDRSTAVFLMPPVKYLSHLSHLSDLKLFFSEPLLNGEVGGEVSCSACSSGNISLSSLGQSSKWIWGPSQQFIVVVTTKTLPNSSDCSSSYCLPKRLAKWGKRHVYEILLALQLAGFFIVTAHSFQVLQHWSFSCSMVTGISVWLLFSLKNSLLLCMFSRKDPF